MRSIISTILNVALPHPGSLSASLDQIAWALTSYIGVRAYGWLSGAPFRDQIRVPRLGRSYVGIRRLWAPPTSLGTVLFGPRVAGPG